MKLDWICDIHKTAGIGKFCCGFCEGHCLSDNYIVRLESLNKGLPVSINYILTLQKALYNA